MRKLITILTAVFLTASIWAQSPQKMSYQAVIRNGSNALVTSTEVGMRISIMQGSETGTEVYKEIHNPNPQTNTNGVVTLEIGSGIPSIGTFEDIDWANGPYFIKTETDPAGGTSYTITGTSQLLSVPYALYAKEAEVDGALSTQNGKIKHDFLTWNSMINPGDPIHIKTNIADKSSVMYRFLIEGYNYGTGKAINSEAVGYTYSSTSGLTRPEVIDHAGGVVLTQYISSDEYVVLKLTAGSYYFIGFSVSGWFVNPIGTGFDISAEVFQQNSDL